MRYFFIFCLSIIITIFFSVYAFAQNGTSKNIIVETAPSGADVKIVYYSWGEVLEQKICLSPCTHSTKLDRKYFIKIKKDGYANYEINSDHPYGLFSKKKAHPDPSLINDLYKNVSWLNLDKNDTSEKYNVVLESETEQKLRKAKLQLANYCPVIFKKHFVAGDRPARPCKLEGPFLNPRDLKNDGSRCDFIFDISSSGFVENIREIHCSSSYLKTKLKKIEGILGWAYFPAIKNGTPVSSIGQKHSLDLLAVDPLKICPDEFAKFENVATHDASPCKRKKPKSPSKLKGNHSCEMKFDLTIEGKTTNIKTLNCTHKSIKKASKKAVSEWLYVPRKDDGIVTSRGGIRTTIHFPHKKR